MGKRRLSDVDGSAEREATPHRIEAENRIRSGHGPVATRDRSDNRGVGMRGSVLPAETALTEALLLVASDRLPAATTVDGDAKREHLEDVRSGGRYGFRLRRTGTERPSRTAVSPRSRIGVGVSPADRVSRSERLIYLIGTSVIDREEVLTGTETAGSTFWHSSSSKTAWMPL